MPAALTKLIARLPFEVALPPPAYLAAAFVVLLAFAVGATSTQVIAAQPSRALEYPTAPAAPEIIDLHGHPVLGVLAAVPELSQFDLLVYNAGERGLLAGQGPHTLYIPAGNYIDYLPSGFVAHLSKYQLGVLVRANINSQLPKGARIFREYLADNGVVYVTDTLVVPRGLQ